MENGKINNNIEILEVKGNEVLIKVTLDDPGYLSTTGRTMVKATTNKFKPVPGLDDHLIDLKLVKKVN